MQLQKTKGLMMAASVVTLLNFYSCKKYEDGPAFSLRSKDARLTGDWLVVKTSDGAMSTDEEIILEFEKGGDFKFTYSYDDNGTPYSYSYGGTWEWMDKKESIKVVLGGSEMNWKVTRLTNSELWFTDEDNTLIECEKK